MSRRRSAARTRRWVAVVVLAALAGSGMVLLVPAAPVAPVAVTVGE